MFEPPDFPYKELTDHLIERYDANDLFPANSEDLIHETENQETDNKILDTASSIDNQLLSLDGNYDTIFNDDSESLFDIGTNVSDILENTELYIIQSDNQSINFESNLLDENIVNQFLLPLEVFTEVNKAKENERQDLLALNSCGICHEIFANDADLLDHTVSVHASADSEQLDLSSAGERATVASVDKFVGTREYFLVNDNKRLFLDVNNENKNNIDVEAEWLICGACERVLSTAVEKPNEQLCCNNGVTSRKLYTMYVCDVCNGLFADADALDRHHLTCLIQEPQILEPTERVLNDENDVQQEVCFACVTCEKQCSSAEELKQHTLEHQPLVRRAERRPYSNASNKMWNCGSCNQLFTTARELYRHKRGEDRPAGAPLPEYACAECDKVLGSLCALHTHKKMHKVTKPGYPCRVCGRRFNQSGHLAIHMRMHTGERPYPCDLCSKAFKVKVERDDHRRTHTGERPFACAACPKTFTAAARLREHARIHTDQRPYRCDICGAAFRRPYARTVHTLIHTGEKPHECDVCGTAFRRSGDMWKHKRTLHGVQANSTAKT